MRKPKFFMGKYWVWRLPIIMWRLPIINLILLLAFNSSFAVPLGDIQSFEWNDAEKRVDISCGTPKVRIIFYKDDIFRIWTSSSSGSWSEEPPKELVIYKGEPIKPTIESSNTSYYLIKTSDCALRVYKTPCKFGLFDANNSNPVFEEASPINLGSSTVQTLTRKTDEHFYGCGAYNGHYCLTDLTVPARYVQKYEINGSPNPAPFYVSRLGYGAFRNTWNNTGSYVFKSTVTTSHGENRFDCYYFYGPSLKKVLRGYTDITGKPYMTPIWGLEIGIAGYYTNASSEFGLAIDCAKRWAESGIPIGWWFPNDSYYAQLNDVEPAVPKLKALNMWTGAWCGKVFEDINNATKCVRDWGIRGFKLDCSWIGSGGKFCFNTLQSTGPGGLEALSSDSARSFQWTTAGWAGSQRFSHAWTGDQYGTMEWLRWHIPTITGACMSAMNGTTVDLAAIFDGNEPEAKGATLYIRCWQWQMWMPYLYLMDGWSPPLHRMPWDRCPSYIDPVLKPSMKLKTRLTPYMYTLCADAYQTGVPAQRPPMLEFPDDRTTWDEGTSSDTKCKQEYMLGPWFLIRPVYEKVSNSTQITMWLPGTSDENWIQYYTGQVAAGAQNVQCEVGLAPNTYDANKPPAIPVWVREGAIVPMWPAQYYNSSNVLIKPNNLGNTLKNSTTAVTGPWTFDIYPSRKKATNFSMYEDDGLTRDYKNNKFARTLITSDATQASGRFIVNIGATIGDYTGKPVKKTYIATIHTGIISPKKKPLSNGVKINGVVVSEKADSASLVSSSEGWWWNRIKNGVVYVKTQEVSTSSSVEMVVDLDMTGVNSDVDITKKELLNKFSLFCNAGKLRLSFENMFTGEMKASIYNLNGRLITQKMIHVEQSKAEVWDTEVSGIYILKLEYKGRMVFRKFTARN